MRLKNIAFSAFFTVATATGAIAEPVATHRTPEDILCEMSDGSEVTIHLKRQHGDHYHLVYDFSRNGIPQKFSEPLDGFPNRIRRRIELFNPVFEENGASKDWIDAYVSDQEYFINLGEQLIDAVENNARKPDIILPHCGMLLSLNQPDNDYPQI